MTKELIVEGMSCMHCVGRVEKTLNAMEGVTSANVDLESKIATVELETEIADDVFISTIDEQGYEVSSIK